jgi:hypothetical protein
LESEAPNDEIPSIVSVARAGGDCNFGRSGHEAGPGRRGQIGRTSRLGKDRRSSRRRRRVNDLHDAGFEPVLREAFQKKFPQIKVNTVVGRDFQLGQQVMAERRAEKYLVDLCITGNITPVTVFHKAKILDPIRPLLVLPEVVNESVWFEGKHHYYDPEDRYIFAFEGTPRSGELTYNTKLVDPEDIRSFWNLLDPKWKGQIVTIDPLVAGPINSGADSFL